MADGAGTPYCADEGYFAPWQMERMERTWAEDARRAEARRQREKAEADSDPSSQEDQP